MENAPDPELQHPNDGIGSFLLRHPFTLPGPFHTADLPQVGPVQVMIQGSGGPQLPPFLPTAMTPGLLNYGKLLTPGRLGK
jgi:hypothetical protein